MADSDPRFNAAEFRDAIQFAMRMGFPEDENQQITWQWDPLREFVQQDSTGSPWEFKASEVTSTETITDMIVNCAISFRPAGASTTGGTPLGVLDVASATVTMLDEEMDALLAHGDGRFPNKAQLDEATYFVQYIAPPYGLFEVTVYDIILTALDEAL